MEEIIYTKNAQHMANNATIVKNCDHFGVMCKGTDRSNGMVHAMEEFTAD